MSNLIPGQKTSRKNRKKPKRRLSPTLAKIANRSLTVTEDQLRQFLPTELLVRIGEAFLEGALTYSEVADMIEVSVPTVSQALKDPVAASWLFNHLRQAIPQRVGLVDVALFNKARTGDVPAMKLFYQHAGELIQRVQVASASLNFNPDQLTDEQLEKFIAAHRRGGDSRASVSRSDNRRRGMSESSLVEESERPAQSDNSVVSSTDESEVAGADAKEVGRADLQGTEAQRQARRDVDLADGGKGDSPVPSSGSPVHALENEAGGPDDLAAGAYGEASQGAEFLPPIRRSDAVSQTVLHGNASLQSEGAEE